MASQKLKLYFLRILGKRNYSEKELIRKGRKKSFNTPEINLEIQYLKDSNLINDQKLAVDIVEDLSGYKGIKWVVQKLHQRGIDQLIIDEVIGNISDNPNEETKRGVKERYNIKQWSDIEADTKYKVVQYLMYKGFDNAPQILEQWQEEAI